MARLNVHVREDDGEKITLEFVREYRRARSKGGFLIHVVDRITGEALCGHVPRGTTRMGHGRRGWTTPESAPITRPCEKCEKKVKESMKIV